MAILAGLAVLMVGVVAGCDDDGYRNHGYFHPYDATNSVVIAGLNADGAAGLAVAATHVDGGYPEADFASVILQNLNTPGTFQHSVDMVVGGNPSITHSEQSKLRVNPYLCRLPAPLYLIPITIESGPVSGSVRIEPNPASFIHAAQSAPV
jgi:hypothetical protein